MVPHLFVSHVQSTESHSPPSLCRCQLKKSSVISGASDHEESESRGPRSAPGSPTSFPAARQQEGAPGGLCPFLCSAHCLLAGFQTRRAPWGLLHVGTAPLPVQRGILVALVLPRREE